MSHQYLNYKQQWIKNMEDDVIIAGCENEDAICFSTGIYRADQLAQAFKGQIPEIASKYCELLRQNAKIEIHAHAFKNGIECEVLSVNSQGWKKGKFKVKIDLEFIPEQPTEAQDSKAIRLDSSLDILRTVGN